ncbi:transposase [Chengkuizengella sp. 2205SS18-9]|uniref:Transposase n=1 Tax=Chengkuizengella axinellae TaxID=3064388 RepID=A0ABT9J6K0_9BACL|nr:transposase [Chengkuizengella sp. 2205SS18-9]MDP5277234.1 transposase [Chengkuizengella sp. 2205SS18-9]
MNVGLHTFDSRMNFNSHVHMLVTMRGMKKTGEWKNYDYIPFEMLRKLRYHIQKITIPLLWVQMTLCLPKKK